jgi:hypothetical protein
VSALLENACAQLAQWAIKAGYTKIVVAGGETSGAVTKALGYDAYLIGQSVAPGVPVMAPLAGAGCAVVLKSGFRPGGFFLSGTGRQDGGEDSFEQLKRGNIRTRYGSPMCMFDRGEECERTTAANLLSARRGTSYQGQRDHASGRCRRGVFSVVTR